MCVCACAHVIVWACARACICVRTCVRECMCAYVGANASVGAVVVYARACVYESVCLLVCEFATFLRNYVPTLFDRNKLEYR